MEKKARITVAVVGVEQANQKPPTVKRCKCKHKKHCCGGVKCKWRFR